ncbi:DNA-directed RNA polymerase I subunit RPA2 [Nematocida sp. AWRm78]|nr:DNA-directed RNA polymerase I subunit RPA2 [Nematocida sp. AWRm79]KAI5182564.1 DNA-directed RNA polymerase I subunit RPA2 [Nematocida sp. AWRm78]
MQSSAKNLAQPHIDSYNRFINTTLPKLIHAFEPVTATDKSNNSITLLLESIRVEKPSIKESTGRKVHKRNILPYECRQTLQTYQSEVFTDICININGISKTQEISLGFIPVMIRSDLCYLSHMTDTELIKVKEEPTEMGGYFIYKGSEKICRLLQIQKKYLPFGIYRPSMSKKNKNMSEHAVSYKSTNQFGQSTLFSLHYFTDHSIKVRVRLHKREYYIPLHLILRGLSGKTDKEIEDSFDGILDTDLMEYVDLLLQSFSLHKEYTQRESLVYLGNKFRLFYQVSHNDMIMQQVRFKKSSKNWESITDIDTSPDQLEYDISKYQELLTDEQVGIRFINDTIGSHTNSFDEKYNLLIICVSKLFQQVSGRIPSDNGDSLSFHETITIGDTLTEIITDKLQSIRRSFRNELISSIHYLSISVNNPTDINRILKRCFTPFTSSINRLLACGILSFTNLNAYAMMQQAGFTIVAERLNYMRFFSHLRSIHRGSFFEAMRTSTVRKLLPESWGFLCPVHTPDGSPCGLLTHLSHACIISHQNYSLPISDLISYGMVNLMSTLTGVPVLQNGRVVGTVSSDMVSSFIESLRYRKLSSDKFKYAEIIYNGSILSIINTPNRFVRPLINIKHGCIEYIGSTEQMYIQIEGLTKYTTEVSDKIDQMYMCNTNPTMVYSVPTHKEVSPTNILSVVSGSTPLGNFNPSPRNMYQCQMAKQSMGTTPHTQKYRTDQKVYSLDYVQTPTLHTNLYSEYGLGEYPNGKNITIAILSYTGYDIEDAVILNKASVNRGFMRGCVLKTESVNFNDSPEFELGTLSSGEGLPEVSQLIKEKDIIYTTVNTKILEEKSHKNSTSESMRVKQISVYQGSDGKRSANITLRIPRIPTIGDKFSSRHGQKGVCSILYEDEDMPFSESGVTPDLIINPHAFPSRMSIGMFIENIASKAGSILGTSMDGTMFKYGEQGNPSCSSRIGSVPDPEGNVSASEYFGDMMESVGFKRGGGEILYSGVTGKPLSVDIFFGIVYYQRLRHMVSDKYQVRTIGPIDPVTKQPVGGRRRGGGIRLGEMERDVLISHGASSLLTDRMLTCSDHVVLNVCKQCSTLSFFQNWMCTECKTSRNLIRAEFPYIFKYLVAELASVNIQCKLQMDRVEA